MRGNPGGEVCVVVCSRGLKGDGVESSSVGDESVGRWTGFTEKLDDGEPSAASGGMKIRGLLSLKQCMTGRQLLIYSIWLDDKQECFSRFLAQIHPPVTLVPLCPPVKTYGSRDIKPITQTQTPQIPENGSLPGLGVTPFNESAGSRSYLPYYLL
ncbi:hypothetical protein GOODEAATRI_029054 [Goodea atripinnis]|uniref:Uncharacterized protein n=1 Tax=Goodea atripinnis TaxID=208336 RepID=A0ABV0Q1W8_9TELE